MSGVVSRWNHTYKNGFMNTRFLSWPSFTSSVGRVSLPQLAEFYFLSWPSFISSVGRISFPQLAAFHFLSWLKHYQKKLFLHGKTIASYTRLTLLWLLFFALKIAKPQSLENITKATGIGQAACPCGVSSFLTWGKQRAPSGQLSYPKL